MKKTKNLNLKIHFSQKTKYKIDFDKIVKNLKKVIQKYCQSSAVEMGVFYVDKAHIRALNQTHRKINQPTDVLSFPQIRIKQLKFTNIGDIVICPQIAQINAKKFQRSLENELIFLAKHGTKHLLGVHHK